MSENISAKEFNRVEGASEVFCSECMEKENDQDCEHCKVTGLLEFLRPKVLFYHNGKKGWLGEGMNLRFTPSDGSEPFYHRIHVIDVTHLDAIRYIPGKGDVKYCDLTLHHMQYEAMIEAFSGTVEKSGFNGWEPL